MEAVVSLGAHLSVSKTRARQVLERFRDFSLDFGESLGTSFGILAVSFETRGVSEST